MEWEDLTEDEKDACMQASMLAAVGVKNAVTQACASIKAGAEGKKIRDNVNKYRAAQGVKPEG